MTGARPGKWAQREKFSSLLVRAAGAGAENKVAEVAHQGHEHNSKGAKEAREKQGFDRVNAEPDEQVHGEDCIAGGF